MQKSRCHHVTLASSDAGEIDYCPSCRIMSLHLGTVTLRVDPAVAEDLRELLGDALSALLQDPGAEPASGPRRDLS